MPATLTVPARSSMPESGDFRGYMIVVQEDGLFLQVWARDDHAATLTAAAHAYTVRQEEQEHEER